MRAMKWKQAGCIGLSLFFGSRWIAADPALPPPVGQNIYQHRPPGQPGGASDATSSDLDSSFDNLDVIDPSLMGKIAVLRVGSEVGENNLLAIFAGMKNKTSHRLNLEVQTIYKDKDGNALNSGSWIPFALEPHEEKEYHSASISEDAVDFLVRVRRAANVPIHG
jgi:hypothetical protein